MANRSPRERQRASRVWYLLLLLPFIGLLWPPFYAKDAPRLGGFPFFYWYQFLWVLIAAVLTAVVYWATTPRSGGDR
jgi:membrane protein implicated in regulation of membrane protease activity